MDAINRNDIGQKIDEVGMVEKKVGLLMDPNSSDEEFEKEIKDRKRRNAAEIEAREEQNVRNKERLKKWEEKKKKANGNYLSQENTENEQRKKKESFL